MRKHRTQLLLLLVLLAGGALFVSFFQLDKARANAFAAERDLAIVHRNLIEIAQANSSGPQIAAGELDAAELTRRLTSAAVDAGVLDHLVDKESSAPARLENSEFNELQITLRFEKISMRQLTVFFDRLAATDPGSRVKSVEMSPPGALGEFNAPGAKPIAAGPEERWTAFVTVGYLMHAPKAK